MEGTQLMLRAVSLSGFSEQSGGHHPACVFTLSLVSNLAGHGSSNFVTEL